MPLSGGTRLGPYEILSLPGALVAAASHDPGRVRRLEQEVRAAGIRRTLSDLCVAEGLK